MGSLEVRLFGPFEAVVAGKPVNVPGAKRQALIACLALRLGRVVSADTLVEACGEAIGFIFPDLRLVVGCDLQSPRESSASCNAAAHARLYG
jgi:hypothetical protein